jgi:hypothetical protein
MAGEVEVTLCVLLPVAFWGAYMHWGSQWPLAKLLHWHVVSAGSIFQEQMGWDYGCLVREKEDDFALVSGWW